MAKSFKIKHILPFLFIIIFASLVLLPNLNKPFIGHHDWNGVFYSHISRNYLRYGLKVTQLGQVTSSGLILIDQLQHYTHYPPLMPLLLALDFKLFGISDITARLFPISLTILSFLVVFRITQKLKLSTLIGLTSTLVVFTPMIRYFSHMPSQEALMVFLSIFSVNLYVSLITNPKPKHRYKFYLVAFFNGLSGWAGYFIYPILAIHAWLFHKKTFPIIFKSILTLIFTFILHLTHTYILTGSITGGGLIDALLLRLNLYPLLGKTPPELPGQFTWLNYLKKQVSWLTVYYTATVLIASFINLLFIIKKLIKRQSIKLLDSITLIFLFWGLTYPIIFSNVVFVHEYFNIFFWPFLAFSLVSFFHHLFNLQGQALKAAGVAVIVTTLIFFERRSFIQALFDTQAHLPGYQLGLEINQNTPPDQTAYIIASEEFTDVQEVFLKYYSDRQII
ncbi:hypothetical protein ACFL18_00005, partial [Patescibacteria group bacterium]